VAEEEVVAQDQANRAVDDELLPDQKRLSDAAGVGLHSIRERQPQRVAVCEQRLDER
jgi:hypothetical protein